jgi:hypothetical protein
MLLRNLLDALVREWGVEEVLRALSQVSKANNEAGDISAKDSRLKKLKMSSAVDQVERSNINTDQKKLLLEIADRFDRKQFLPSNADVREFLIMRSYRPGAIKNRSEAFRVLLKVLEGVPAEGLDRLVKTSRHSGPAQLGPLSDAISNVGTLLPRRREPRDT